MGVSGSVRGACELHLLTVIFPAERISQLSFAKMPILCQFKQMRSVLFLSVRV